MWEVIFFWFTLPVRGIPEKARLNATVLSKQSDAAFPYSILQYFHLLMCLLKICPGTSLVCDIRMTVQQICETLYQ